MNELAIRFAVPADSPTILGFIRELAEYEKLLHEVVADEQALRATLFGARPAAEVLIAEVRPEGPRGSGPLPLRGDPVGFALFFPTYSTFLARPGLWLEDLFVRPAARGQGVGGALMAALARIAVDRGYGRFEWNVLDWNAPALTFYASLGARPMAEWTGQRVTGDALHALAARCPTPIARP